MLKKISPSVIVYFIILAIIIILRLLISIFPAEQISEPQVNLTDPISIGAIWLVGWVGVYLAQRAGFAGMWQADISNKMRLLIPALIGILIGIATIILDLIHPLGGESLIKFPTSLVAYPLGGILEEIIFRLFLTTLLVWIISNMLLGGRWQEPIFWAVNVFLGVFYTLSQLSLYQSIFGTVDLLTVAHFILVIAIYFILAAYFYRRYGFLAALSMRLGDYVVWHIIWGAIAK